MANRLFQGVIHQMKDAIDRTFGVVDENMTVIASSELGKIGESVHALNVTNDIIVSEGYTYKNLGIEQGGTYTVFVEGDDAIASKYASILVVSLQILNIITMKNMTVIILSKT